MSYRCSLKLIKVTRPVAANVKIFTRRQSGIIPLQYNLNIKSNTIQSYSTFGLNLQFANTLISKKFTTSNARESIQLSQESVVNANTDIDLSQLRLLLQKERYGSIAGAIENAKKQNIPLTQEHYQIAIQSYCYLRKSKKILDLLQEMSQKKIPITITEYNYLLKSVVVELSSHPETMTIKKMIEDSGYKLDAFSYGILIHSCVISLEYGKHVAESRALIEEMKQRRIYPNLQFYEEVIRSYHHRDAKSIIYWYKRMTKDGHTPPKDILPIIKNALIRCRMRQELQEFMSNVWNQTNWSNEEGTRVTALDLVDKLEDSFITPETISKLIGEKDHQNQKDAQTVAAK